MDSRVLLLGANKIEHSTGYFASPEFNQAAPAVTISGVREFHGELFAALADQQSPEQCGALFHDYMEELFALKMRVRGKRLSGYIRLLRGWLFDAGSREGAVLKAWVESRFGMVPIYHNRLIADFGDAYHEYLQQAQDRRLNRNQIHFQLDLLYAYTQLMLERWRGWKTGECRQLFRGVNAIDEHLVLERLPDQERIIYQNALASFTDCRDIASQFGDYILEAGIPRSKVLFASGLLPRQSFAGEREYLVIGGACRTRICSY